MYQAIFVNPWPWWAAGLGVGLCVIALAWLANRPLSVTTGFGTVCGLGSNLSYFQKDEFGAKSYWRLGFLAAMIAGAGVSSLLAGNFGTLEALGALAPQVGTGTEVALLLGGGVAVGFGSRFAGGCTSGHSIVGTANLAPSSFVATGAFMAAGAVTVFALYALLGVA